ncbi:FliC/FljB family flagellin [Halomonas marinisediminis]|uniref:Flagellin n=1 Tax=Halomonas marinisediminis TaxID=2546095 RepID=A0ABY2D5Z4_9GAMM|nr:FliC/FljB family flagellin [Halomonas marinisediminis]TDB01946.1 FliC/FljB family flagellin [Halomonas marinisediminis]
MSVINTNITSLIGQQNLMKSQNALQTSMERLSSGLRINSAKDDAAGQAIANRMSAQITGLGQAQRNANDGISVAQTAEGALNQVNDNLQRIRELSVQAQNGTNSQEDLKSIQAEIQQRLGEIDRISEETDFNGTKVLESNQDLKIQVGANDDEAITINLQKIDASSLGLSTFNISGAIGNVADIDGDAAKLAYGEKTGVTSASVAVTGGTDNDWQTKLGLSNAPGGTTSVTAKVVSDENNNWFVETTLSDITDPADKARMEELGFTEDPNTAGSYKIYMSVDPQDADTTTTATAAAFDVDLSDYSLDQLASGATTDPLATLDTALSKVDTLRSDLGAIQNRFESAITNLQTNETNLAAARSRIEDADYAVEVANMTRAQILQQAGTSVLAQANQVPQSVLSLLG